MVKKFILFIFAFIMSIQSCYAYSAESYCVIDAVGKRILDARNERKRMGMASTTKIMTALVALNHSEPDDIVTISREAAYTEGSSLYLKEGEQIKMIDLLYGLMLNSGNDAAVAIAQHISGDTERFAELMTETAHEIGALDTNFINSNGLSDNNHYTTAYDLALITAKALENDIFSKIVSTKSYTASTINTSRKLYFTNHNKLLNMIDGCDGVKTGFTKATGRCLVSSVTQNGWRAICVTLNSPDDWNDHKQMFEYVFDKYYIRNILTNESVIKSTQTDGIENNGVLEIGVRNNVDMVVCDDDEIRMDTSKISDKIQLPVNINDSVGSVGIFLNNEQVMSVEAVSHTQINLPEKMSYNKSVIKLFKKWVSFEL